MAYRKADPVPDAHAESMVLEWAVGEPEPMRPATLLLPGVHPETTPERGHPVHHPHRRSRRGCCRGAAVGAVGQHGDHRHPLARQGHPHPPADAPANGGTWRCWWRRASSTTSAWRRRGRRILVKGRTSKEMVMVEDSPGEGGPPGEAQDHRGRPGPARRTRSPTSPHRRLTPRAAPRGPAIPLPGNGGASLRLDATPL